MASYKEEAGAQPKGTRRDNRFVQGGTGDGTQKGNNTTKIDVKQSPVGGTEKLEGATSQPQAATEDVDMMEDHLMRANLHGHFRGFPHQEGDPSMEDRDDSTRIILKLPWTHQDYFDQKSLSKAQAEYNYYRTLDRTWKKTEGADAPPKEIRRNNRFDGDGTQKGNNTAKIDVKQPPVGGPEKLEGATSQPQAATEDVDMMEDHCMRAHLHGLFPGFPHHQGDPSMEVQDDSTRIILKLLRTHQDYFDQKALSKAQAEYNFYRTLERTWKKTVDRVKMDDIKHEKFKMEMFLHLPRQRPLFAVIATILEQSKEKKDAEGAAEEYYRMRVLEDTMIKQKMITAIPEGIDLDQAHFSELYSNMKARFKTSGRQTQMRQAAEFKTVPLVEYLKLKETITHQRNQIEELASRLSGNASQQLADGDPGFTELGDKNRPHKLGEKFAELFEESWASAYESLKPKNPEPDADEDDETDDKTVNMLQQVVKVIYEFCQKVAQEQNTRIVGGMIPPIIDPYNVVAGKSEDKTAVEPPTEFVKTKTDQLAKQYRKVIAPATIKVLNKKILENELKGKLLTEPVNKEVESYVHQCIYLVWYMCIQQPPMEIMWAKPGEKFNTEVFQFSGRKGKKFKRTVWPAVFLHKGGPLVVPGYAVPE